MAYFLEYVYKDQHKRIGYANDKHQDMFVAAAKNEGVDTKEYLNLEGQMRNIGADKPSMHNFRDNYFAKLGFRKVKVVRAE